MYGASSMEYSRKVSLADGPTAAVSTADSRVMDFGSVFFTSPVKDGDDASPALPTAGSQQAGLNVAELLVGRGFATVIRHRDFEERSNYYDGLLAAESRAVAGKKGIHSAKDPPVMHITDLLTRNRRMPAVVEYVLSGHRFKLFIPKKHAALPFHSLIEVENRRQNWNFLGIDPDAHLLMQAELSAKRQKLKLWESYIEGEEVSNGSAAERKQKEELK
ncbi:unnamed protein product, partial [Ilex paraguariensis]